MTAATILHADGTPCAHQPGPGRAARSDGKGSWWCPGGRLVTHLRYAGTDIPVADAIDGFAAVAAAVTAALTPVLRAVTAALARFDNVLGADPRLRVLAAACGEYDTEAAREAAMGEHRAGMAGQLGRGPRAAGGDPCGDGQITGQLPLPGTSCGG